MLPVSIPGGPACRASHGAAPLTQWGVGGAGNHPSPSHPGCQGLTPAPAWDQQQMWKELEIPAPNRGPTAPRPPPASKHPVAGACSSPGWAGGTASPWPGVWDVATVAPVMARCQGQLRVPTVSLGQGMGGLSPERVLGVAPLSCGFVLRWLAR